MFHRGCILSWCNADSVDIYSQMNFDNLSAAYQRQQKTTLCPLCQESIPISCDDFRIVERVPNDRISEDATYITNEASETKMNVVENGGRRKTTTKKGGTVKKRKYGCSKRRQIRKTTKKNHHLFKKTNKKHYVTKKVKRKKVTKKTKRKQ